MKDSFGARLKFFRSKAGLSQQQLADKTGLSRKIISDYEVKLDVIPRDTNLYKIAEALNIDSSNLIPKTKGDAKEQPDGSYLLTYNINEFPRQVVETLSASAEKNNRSIQDEFQILMIEALERLLDSPEDDIKTKFQSVKESKIHQDENAFENFLANNSNT